MKNLTADVPTNAAEEQKRPICIPDIIAIVKLKEISNFIFINCQYLHYHMFQCCNVAHLDCHGLRTNNFYLLFSKRENVLT